MYQRKKYRANFKRLLAAWALLTFMLAVTPRLYLHDLVFNHVDHQFSNSGELSFKTYDYNCGLVLEGMSEAFTEGHVFERDFQLRFFQYLPTYLSKHIISADLGLVLLRGPPFTT
ncbi:MAG: hypothetical protein QM727_09270 [Niabella sp.]